LSGDGGDELFGGYPRYRAAQFYDRFWRHVPRPLRQVAASLSEIGHHRELHRFLSGASAGRDHAFDIWNNRCPIPACEARLTSQPGLENGLTTAMMEFDRDVTLPGNQLVMSDRCGMAHGVEYRLPLLGHDVVRIAASAPTSQHLEHGPKTVWRQAITSYLPAGHVENGKIGFNPPVAKWLGELARYLWGNEADILEAVFADIAISSAAKVTCWRQAVSGKDLDMALGVWALMVWQIWLGLDQSNARGTADTA
jgi:asparagine synthase (glutamine-hydrolysing)